MELIAVMIFEVAAKYILQFFTISFRQLLSKIMSVLDCVKDLAHEICIHSKDMYTNTFIKSCHVMSLYFGCKKFMSNSDSSSHGRLIRYSCLFHYELLTGYYRRGNVWCWCLSLFLMKLLLNSYSAVIQY